jgi:hypothetical protein
VKLNITLRLTALFAVTSYSVAVAQGPATEQIANPVPATPIVLSAGCNLWKTQLLPSDLSFNQRLCIGFSELANPWAFLGSGVAAGLSQWRNSPHMKITDYDDISVRFEHIYERRAARITAEILVGYWHHEDLRPHSSGQKGVWHRTGAALLSVLESPDSDGHARIAFAPLAGSLGSGLTSMALYQTQNSIGWGLERSGLIYTHYFVRALYHEFSPELWSLAPHFIRKYHTADIPAN